MRRKPTFLDLFCGAGGWTQGLKSAGLRHVGGVDKDANALKTYAANHGQRGAVHGDVTEISVLDLKKAIGQDSVDIVAASPPCQGFSSAGPRRIGDPADRLCECVPRLARGLSASTIVMENVAGMATKKDAAGNSIVESFLKKLRKAGFGRIECRVVRCEEHGVPQTRRRLLIIATTTSGQGDPSAMFPIPETSDAHPAVSSLRQLLQPRQSITDPFYWMNAKKAKYYEDRHASEKTKAYVRFLNLDRIAFTVRASYAKSRGAEALVRYSDGRMRMLTELECARDSELS